MMPHTKSLCLTLAGVLVLLSSVAPASQKGRSYASENTALMLDGVNCGFVRSVDGGAISAEVVHEPAGPNYFVKKHIGQPKYGEFAVQVGFGMAKPLYDWIQQSWGMKYQRKNGSVVAMDYQLQARSERQFFNALITETTVPAMDGASKEPAYLTLKFAPEYTRVMKPDGKTGSDAAAKTEQQKTFLPCNFQLEIDGLDCSKVHRVESFTVRQTAVAGAIGDQRDYAKEPGKLEFPNVRITIAETLAQPFLDWHESFVIKGDNDETKEKNGSLTLLTPNRQTALARIKFFNMGIFFVQPEKSDANADTIKRLTVEMYVERMEFEYAPADGSSGATGTKPSAPATKPAPMRRG
jgi:hypothetical protein